MFNKHLSSILLFLLAFSLGAHSSPVDLRHVVYVKEVVKPANTTTISRASGRSATIGLLMGQNSAAHLTSQNYRSSHFVKQAAIFNTVVVIAQSCSKYV